jgi:signal transduction histidine kinase
VLNSARFSIFLNANWRKLIMMGTNHSTSGSPRVTWPDASYRRRLAVLALSLAAGVFLISWMKVGIWKQMGQLRKEFSVPTVDVSFHDSVQLAVARLNRYLRDYCVYQKIAARDGFGKEVLELRHSLNQHRGMMQTTDEQKAFGTVELLCTQYFSDAEQLFRTKETRGGPAVATSCESLQEEGLRLHLAINDLSAAQNATGANLLRESERTLYRLENLLKLSLFFQWMLALFLAFLGYRGMIAPLRNRLSESRALIERQEKLASLGVLAAGVAHEIRNPLTAIKFRLFSLKNSLPEISSNEDARVVDGEINRLDRIVKDFLQFARPSEPELIEVPAERLIQQVSQLMRPTLEKSGIEFKTEMIPDLWMNADVQQIEQVLINLVQNAADSIANHGTITLEAKKGVGNFDGKAEPAIILAVSDTGKGISPEVEKRLFDPFFTTKEGGTGLGLAIAARIVEKHGGVLRHRSKLNTGTTFEIVLPNLAHHALETVTH